MTPTIAIIMLIFGSAIGSLGGFFLKKGHLHLNPLKLIKERELIGGVILYLLAALIMIWALKVLDIIVATMLTSMTYVFSLLLGRYFLQEKITRNKIVGIILIIIGILMIIFAA